jgi:hypothetical protein
MLAALIVSLSLIVLLTGWAEAASAKTFRVNNRRDKVDANIGDGRCDADLDKKGKQCTLRAASQEADFDQDTVDTIRVPKNVYKLTIPADSCGDDTSCGDIDLDGKVNLIGAGPFKAIVDAQEGKGPGHRDEQQLRVQAAAQALPRLRGVLPPLRHRGQGRPPDRGGIGLGRRRHAPVRNPGRQARGSVA